MSSRAAKVIFLLAACLAGLGGCSTASKFGGLGKPADGGAANGTNTVAVTDPALNDFPNAAARKAGDVTGSINVQPAEPGPNREPVAPLSKPGLVGDNPNDDVQLGKRYFRSNNFGLAEKSFRSAVQKHPRDAEAWVGLAASYDRLRRFDLADRAYGEAIRIIGPTAEILNDQGFSYMLRGDFARAQKKLQEAQLRDPTNPYIRANLRLLEDSYREGKAVQ